MSKKGVTKLCKHCKSEISKDTKVCPICNKKQGGVFKWGIIAIVVIGIGGTMAESETGTPSETGNIINVTNPGQSMSKSNEEEIDYFGNTVEGSESVITPSPEPTVAPTPEPTMAPTPEPTKAPSPEPIEVPITDPTGEESAPSDNNVFAYVLNTSTQKIHYPHCKSVAKIKPENYATTDKSLEDLLNEGYTKCGNCW